MIKLGNGASLHRQVLFGVPFGPGGLLTEGVKARAVVAPSFVARVARRAESSRAGRAEHGSGHRVERIIAVMWYRRAITILMRS